MPYGFFFTKNFNLFPGGFAHKVFDTLINQQIINPVSW